jgi:hypothetical protein
VSSLAVEGGETYWGEPIIKVLRTNSDNWIEVITEKYRDDAFKGCGKLPLKTRSIIQGWGYTGTF